ncbi:MAG: DUF4834 family protein [Muribaculaceae bacterium]|nr:DUF4834 family protein [Muribaculaceae bacterium]
MFGFILLCIFIAFIVIPLGKAIWRGYQLQRNWRRATEGFREAYRRNTSSAGNNQATPRRKKKKIDPNVGEYVAFEEIKVETTTYTATESGPEGTTTTTYTESQIEDAVWEEIK